MATTRWCCRTVGWNATATASPIAARAFAPTFSASSTTSETRCPPTPCSGPSRPPPDPFFPRGDPDREPFTPEGTHRETSTPRGTAQPAICFSLEKNSFRCETYGRASVTHSPPSRLPLARCAADPDPILSSLRAGRCEAYGRASVCANSKESESRSAEDGPLDRLELRGQLEGMVCIARGNPKLPQGALVVLHLEVRELQAVGGRDHHDPLPATNHPARNQFFQHGQGNPRVRVVEHAGQVGSGRRISQLILGRLLHDAIKAHQRPHRAVVAHRVADADCRSQRSARKHRLQPVKPARIRQIQRVGPLRLSHRDPWQGANQAQLVEHQE